MLKEAVMHKNDILKCNTKSSLSTLSLKLIPEYTVDVVVENKHARKILLCIFLYGMCFHCWSNVQYALCFTLKYFLQVNVPT